jgi:multidrug efflux system outer membrane protein
VVRHCRVLRQRLQPHREMAMLELLELPKAHVMRAMSRPMRARTAIAAATLLMVAGCAVGPNYKAPAVAIDPSFISAGSTAVNAQTPAVDIATFWRGFSDPVLTQLVERALAANGDVRIAQARLQEARATLSGARAELLPQIGLAGDASRALAPEYLYPGTSRSQRTANAFDANFTASWELDIFGRNKRASESASALLDASEAGIHAAQTSVAAEVARNYLDLRGLQQRYDVARQSLDNQKETLRLTSVRLDAGRGTQLDVARARSLFDSTEATLPALQAAVERDAFRLATLTAQSPRVVLDLLATSQPLPSLPVTDLGALPLGTPEMLLRRRPDLVAAERQLASATANIGVATADLFPRVSLTGLLGFASNRVADLGKSDSLQYSAGAGLTWPLLDFGRVRSRIAQNEARAGQALASYEQTVATALEETEGALSQFTRAAQQADRLASSTRNAEEATRLSRLRFNAGSVDLLIVLDAERQALSARDALVQAQVGQATALVSVYRSLGGGWSADSVTAASNP